MSQCTIILYITGKDRDAEEEEENAKHSDLSEPEKQLRKLKKKLQQVEKLRARQENGEILEKNQARKSSILSILFISIEKRISYFIIFYLTVRKIGRRRSFTK